MCHRRLVICLALTLLAACGPDELQFEIFTFELLDVAEGDRVRPGQELKYRLTYRGELAHDLTITTVFLREATGEQVTFSSRRNAPVVRTIDETGRLLLGHDFLKTSG